MIFYKLVYLKFLNIHDGDDNADLICFGPGKEVKIFGVTNKLDHEAIKKAKILGLL